MCANFVWKRHKSVLASKIQLFMVLLACIIPMASLAINADQWQIDHFQVEDGLPDSTVYSMAQDQTGFMWFGTTNGLARFDGYGFKTLQHDGADTNTLANNNAGNIFIDKQNNLWIGTFGAGVNLLDLQHNSLARFPYTSNIQKPLISENVQSFFQDSDGDIWVGTAAGLYQYVDGDFIHIDANNSKSEISQSRVWDIEGDQFGNLWLGTSDGLLHVNTNTEQLTQYTLPSELTVDVTSNQFRSLLLKNNKLWIGSSSGLYSFDVNLKSYQFYSLAPSSIKVNDLYEAPEGGILIATMEGLYLFDSIELIYKSNPEGDLWQPLSHADVRQIYIDRSDIMWLATRDNGVYKIDLTGGLFKHHTNYLPLSQRNEQVKKVWALETDQSGHLIMGTSDTVFKLEADKVVASINTPNHGTIPGIIRDIEVDVSGGQWVASSQGLYYIAANTTIAEMNSKPFDLVGMAPTDVFSIEITEQGEIWLALYNLGVLYWNPTKNQAQLIQEYKGETFSDLNITHIFADSRSNIWIGSNLIGVFKFQPKLQNVSHYNHDYNDLNSIESNRVKDIYEDSAHRLWVATARGLSRYLYDQEQFINYSQADGLISGAVEFILEDTKQNLWVGNQFGLSQFNPSEHEVKNYFLNTAIRNDGLISRAATIDDNDVIYMGSANGFYTFNPKDHQYNAAYQPPLVINSVLIDNRSVQSADLEYKQNQFVLEHDDQQITLMFSVLDYKTPEQIQYLYRLHDLHEDWLDVSETRRIDLKDLTPADYQLSIKAVNNDGRWSEQVRDLLLVVKPAWWEVNWVRGLFLLAIIIIAISFHYYRTYIIRKQNKLLEHEVSNRTLKLQELNEQLELAANSDFLTALPNRMSFINQIEQMKKQTGDAFFGCMVLADVDNFKSINDQYGHSAGDEILVELSHIMKKQIRDEDLIARWGGEEFIFYFNSMNKDEALNLVELIRKNIESNNFNYNHKIIPVTVTFGISVISDEMSLINSINAADEALYLGKRQGKNKVVIYTQ